MLVIVSLGRCASYRSIRGRARWHRCTTEDRRGLTPGVLAGDAEPGARLIAGGLAVPAYPPQAGPEPCHIADALTTGAGGWPSTIGRPLALCNHRIMGASTQ